MRGHRRVYPQAVRIHYHNWDPRWDENAERGGIGIDRIRPSSALLRPLEVSLTNHEGAMDHGRRTHTHTHEAAPLRGGATLLSSKYIKWW